MAPESGLKNIESTRDRATGSGDLQQSSAPRRNAVFVFLLFLCAFWLTSSGFDTSEARYHYQVAEHFVATGKIGFDQAPPGVFTTAPNGRTYASHEFGNILFLIPTAAADQGLGHLLHRLGMERVKRIDTFVLSFQAGIYAALIVTLIYLILTVTYGQTHLTAVLACCALGFGTFFWNYSRILFDGLLCGLLLVGALRSLLEYRRTGSLIRIAAAFALFGLSVTTRLSMIIPTAVAIGFVMFADPRRRWRALTVGVIALAPFAAWQIWYNQLRTGNPFLSPVQTAQYAAGSALDGDIVTGLIGLLVSPGKGLFVYAPLLIISAVAFPRFWRRDRLVAAYILVTGVLWLILHAKLRSWYGAWGWGPRYMITLVPLLALPGLVHLPEWWATRLGRLLATTVLVAGFLLAFAGTVGNWNYRMKLARLEGRLDDASFVWGRQSQAVDMVVGAGRNIAVVAGVVPPINIPGSSYFTNHASNRINVWWLTLPQAGIPRPLVAAASALLLGVLVWSGRRVMRPQTS